ncbi:hypothetical protein F7Q99_00575 [Streptomyces kaniharaensis]|uniref:Uncharacterized protein n=1 Tax=Streptomyces kaniharaensis TaxID=212423 RepID=A0A6N7KH90_9ACTN|nr:hypothetical protein [Streptomyces kaniharaensis]MQS10810.1 hypothetical protein [Streptomyces kaniharaensis]
MSELYDLRARLAALESEVDRLRKESAATPTMADRSSADVRTPQRDRRRVLDAVGEEQVEQRQVMTRLAEAVGVLVSGQAQQTMVLQTRTRSLETQSRTTPQHSQFLESLLAGQSPLFEELRRPDDKQ